MQNYCKTIGTLAAASALVVGTASAEVDYLLHTGYSSEDPFRGQDRGDDLVEVGANVKGDYNGFGLSGGAWSGTFDDQFGDSTSELDLYAEVTRSFEWASLAAGYIYYTYPEGLDWRKDSQEVYFSVAHDFCGVEASFTYYWDIDGADNNGYSELALGRAFELSHCLALNVGTNVGYQFEEGQCTAWTTKVALEWTFAEHAKLSPFVTLSIALSDDEDSTYTHNSGNELIGGTMLSVGF